jgi:TolB-like protein
MPDVFLSYSRADRDVARRFAEALQAAGLEVWWDVGLAAGEAYDRVTEEALTSARAVVVLWSKTSVDSRWVRAEATQGDRNGTLVPVMIEDCKRPVMFELVHTADLTRWKGKVTDPAWQAFLADVRRVVGREGPAPAAAPPARRAGPSRALLIGAAVALVAAVGLGFLAFHYMGGAGSGLDPHRIAFFGVTAPAGDPVASGMASSATDEIIQTLTAADLQTLPRAETQGVPLADQLARAKQLGARYALAGDVRNDGKTVRILLRLDDAARGKTLWEGAVPGQASDTVSLPVLAGAQATILMRCLIGNLDEIKPATDQLMAVLPRACAEVFAGTKETVRLWNQVVELAPKSTSVRAGLAWVTLNPPPATPAEAAKAIADSEQHAREALRLDPRNPLARGLLARAAMRAGKPLAEVEQMHLAAIKEAPKEGLQVGVLLTNPISGVVFIRLASGRARDALPYARQNVEGDPVNPTVRIDVAVALARSGRPAEATKVYDEANARSPSQSEWEAWLYDAAFNGLGGADHVLAAAPSSVSQDSVSCWKGVIAAAHAPGAGPQRAAMSQADQCMAARSISPYFGIVVAALLGDMDSAFARTEQLGRGRPFLAYPLLFDPATKAMRNDPRFIPLVTRLGLMDYWKTTGTRPDVCDTEDVPLCALLKKPG